MATKTEKYITEPIIKRDDSPLSRIEATYNILMQKVKPKFNFTVKFFTFNEAGNQKMIDPRKLDGYNDDKTPEMRMILTYSEDFPVGPTLVAPGNNFNRVRENADELMTLIKKVYKDVIGEEFPWKFEKEREIAAEEVGFRKFRYKVALSFIGKK